MFAYQPQQSRAGEVMGRNRIAAADAYAEGTLARAQIEAAKKEREYQSIMGGIGAVGDIVGIAAGAALGGAPGLMAASSGGGLLNSVIGAYAQKEQDKSDSKMYGNLMKIVAPAFGKDGDSILDRWKSLESDRDRAQFGSTLFSSLGQISNMYMANRSAGIRENAPMLNAGLQGAARVAGGEGTVPLPAMDNTTPPPTPLPSPDAMSAATAWYNQSKGGMMQTGTMKPFYRN